MVRPFSIAFVAALTLASAVAVAGGMKCQCRYDGRVFDQGQLVCIRVDSRTKLARCDMALNNSSWTFLQNGCPTAMATPIPSRPVVVPRVQMIAFPGN